MIEKKLQRNVILAPFTTFKIGGPAAYFIEAHNEDDLLQALQWVKSTNIPYFILGGGSNILIADKGFDGLVVKMRMNTYTVLKTNIIADAGVFLSTLVSVSLKNSLTGLEWAAGVPGTIGGAVRGNAGAHGHSISELVTTVRVIRKESVVELENNNCKFSYRHSIFKKKNNNDSIVRVVLKLKKGNNLEIEKGITKHITYRNKTQPFQSSCGCIFKNINFSAIDKESLRKFPEMNEFKDYGQIPSGWLIDSCSLKRTKKGKVAISDIHANFIENSGSATAHDVRELIARAKSAVKQKFGIDLEEEIIYVGFF
ncbi:UDP-N-acetylmuramate dehydrogenase [Patescibacteria group bacterium AH-259-L07]|nr:UDP-N-acetylmuramate dehydrogenase [Patescibacteria group bacterium AH-259-L07]